MRASKMTPCARLAHEPYAGETHNEITKTSGTAIRFSAGALAPHGRWKSVVSYLLI